MPRNARSCAAICAARTLLVSTSDRTHECDDASDSRSVSDASLAVPSPTSTNASASIFFFFRALRARRRRGGLGALFKDKVY